MNNKWLYISFAIDLLYTILLILSFLSIRVSDNEYSCVSNVSYSIDFRRSSSFSSHSYGTKRFPRSRYLLIHRIWILSAVLVEFSNTSTSARVEIRFCDFGIESSNPSVRLSILCILYSRIVFGNLE